MEKIILKTGEIIDFDKIDYKEDRFIRLNLVNHPNLEEEVWAVIDEKCFKDYKTNKIGGKFIARLANDAFIFYPKKSWGLHVVGEFRGKNRPVANLKWVDYSIKENRIWAEEVPEAERY